VLIIGSRIFSPSLSIEEESEGVAK